MSEPKGHYVQTKDGPTWVGPSRSETEHLRQRLRIARGALIAIQAGTCTLSAQLIATDALELSKP